MNRVSFLLAGALLLTAAGASAQSPATTTSSKPVACARHYTRSAAGGGSVTYFEAVPTHDAQHVQFAKLRQVFAETKPTVVFYEKPDCALDSTEAATIGRLGESGYVRLLAQQHQIPVERLDDPAAEYAYLQTKVEAEQLKLYYLLRLAQQFRESTGARRALTTKAMQQYIKNSSYFLPGTEGVIRNIAELQAAYQKHCPTGGKWQQASATWFGATPTAGSALADVNRLACEFRTAYLNQKLAAYAQAGQRVLVVIGQNHVPAAPALASARAMH